MSVRSRAPWRPTLLEACNSFSTSAGVKYSRVRRSRFLVRRGGIEGEGVWSDLGPEAFLLRRLERTFPFSSIGARFAAAAFLDAFAMAGSVTPPIWALYGKVLAGSSRTKDKVQRGADRVHDVLVSLQVLLDHGACAHRGPAQRVYEPRPRSPS